MNFENWRSLSPHDKFTITVVNKMYSIAGILLSTHPCYISVRWNSWASLWGKMYRCISNLIAIFSFFKWVRIQLNAVYLMSYHDILFFSSLLLSEICTIYNKVISIRCLYSVFFFHARYIQGHLIVFKKTRWNGHILRKIIFLKNFLFHFYTWWQNIFLYMYRP